MSAGYLYDLYIPNRDTNSVAKVVNGVVQKIIPVGNIPYGVAIDKNKIVWITNSGSNDVSKIVNDVVVLTIPVGSGPRGICVKPNGAICVTNYNDNTVSIIFDDKVIATIPTGNNPYGICCNPLGELYVASGSSSNITKINTDNSTKNINGGHAGEETNICCDLNNAIWVTCWTSNAVVKIVNDVVVKTINVGTNPWGICCDKNNYIWVANSNSYNITKIKNDAFYKTITVGTGLAGTVARGIHINYDNDILIADSVRNDLYRIKNDIFDKTIPLFSASTDGCRSLGDATGMQAAMLFGWYVDVNINSDSARNISSNVNILSDTTRKIYGEIQVNINSDSTRKISNNISTLSDSARNISANVSILSDTTRTVIQGAIDVSINSDTNRKTSVDVNFNFDTSRKLAQVIDSNFKPSEMGIKSLTIATGVQSLSDRFTIESVGKAFGGVDNFQGEIAGFKFAFEKATAGKSTNSMGTTFTTQGRPDMGDLLFANVNMVLPPIWYNTGYVISKTAKQLCADLGIDANITDFTPLGIGTFDAETFRFTIKEKTVKAFLDKLFSWSSEFADRQMYYFLRNGKITVQEVGRYTANYNLDDKTKYRIENSTSNEQKIRKFVDYSKNTGDGDSDGDISTVLPPKTPGANTVVPFSYNIPFSGTTSYGDASLTYSGGLLTRESTDGSTTNYSYETAQHCAFASSKNVLKKKVTLSNDSRTTTTYEYDIVASSVYESAEVDVTLTSERTVVEIKSAGAWEIDSDHQTIHVPIGNGFFGQRVEEIVKENGGDKRTTVATSISRGSSGGLASMYTVQLINGFTVIPPDPTHPPDPTPIDNYDGELITGYSIPVADISVLNSLIQKINWMNLKIEETINLSVIILPGNDLVDAVSGAITFEGNLYYIQSTNATINAKGTRQQISAVRWYQQ